MRFKEKKRLSCQILLRKTATTILGVTCDALRRCATRCLMQYEMNPSNGSTVTKWCTEKHSKKHKGFYFVVEMYTASIQPQLPALSVRISKDQSSSGFRPRQVRLQVHLEHIFKMSYSFTLCFLNTAWSPRVTQRFYGGREWESECVFEW